MPFLWERPEITEGGITFRVGDEVQRRHPSPSRNVPRETTGRITQLFMADPFRPDQHHMARVDWSGGRVSHSTLQLRTLRPLHPVRQPKPPVAKPSPHCIVATGLVPLIDPRKPRKPSTKGGNPRMGDKSRIEWTDATNNPVRYWPVEARTSGHFCLRVSPGCDHCYASRLQPRLGTPAYPAVGTEALRNANALVYDHQVFLHEDTLVQPLHWRRSRRIFLNSMSDTFGEWVLGTWLDQMFAVMALAQQHTFQVLTKRPKRMVEYMLDPATPHRVAQCVRDMTTRYFPGALAPRWPLADLGWPLPNVWLGVTVESDAYTWRAKMLSDIPAAVRFVSAEPLLGPLPSLDLSRIDWLIAGGESGGPYARALVDRHRIGWTPKPYAVEWVRALRDQAQAAHTAFFWKQWCGSMLADGSGRFLDGVEHNEYPEARHAVRT